MLVIAPSQWEDVLELGSNLSPEDQVEIWASHGHYPVEGVANCYDRSIDKVSAYYNGHMLGMSGLVPGSILGNWASPWLLTTPEMRNHPVFLVRHTKKMLEKWLNIYSVLENFVDARHTPALKWAKAVGFTIAEAQVMPWMYEPMPFHRITIRRD